MPLLNAADDEDDILVDFQDVRFYHPAPIVALLARLTHWHKNGKKVQIAGHTSCPASSYLRRVDFFEQLGIRMEENFKRHAPAGRFVPIKRITNRREVDPVSSEIAKCMSHGNIDFKECLGYSIGEILTNVAQHSAGDGFVCAQRYRHSNTVYFAVADNGIGLRRSFEGTELESVLTSPLLALEKAMEPKVSSALLRPPSGPYGSYENKGIGLSMVNELVTQTHGHMDVCTENALFHRSGNVAAGFSENDTIHTPGVLIQIRLNADEIDDFETIITHVRSLVTPESTPNELDNWDSMFD